MKSLVDCSENITLILVNIDIKDRFIFDKLSILGLYLGSKFKIIAKKSIYILDIRRSRIIIPVDIAKQLFVEEII